MTFQRAVLDLVGQVIGEGIEDNPITPSWLMRPGKIECGERWSLICSIYRELTGLELSEVMPKKERRQLDGIVKCAPYGPRIVEVDESQHFNCFRGKTLHFYPAELRIAFDARIWIDHSQDEPRQKSGGWAKERPPLFPDAGGRHRQRAFRDALADILPLDHGFLPTLRIAYFEVEPWIGESSALKQMENLLNSKNIRLTSPAVRSQP